MDRMLEFGMLFSAIDHLTGPVKRMAQAVSGLAKAAEAGERMAALGEHMTLLGGIAREGAEKLKGFVEAPIERAAEMQAVMARLGAVTGLAGAKLAEIQEHAEKFSESAAGFGSSAEDYLRVYQQLYQTLGNAAAAQRAADDAVRIGELTNTSAADAVNLLTVAHETLGVSSAQMADQIAATQRLFRIGSPSEYANNLSRVAAIAGVTHTSLADLNALLGEAGEQMPGGRGMMRMAMILRTLAANVAQGKAAVDLSGGLLPALQRTWEQIKGLPQIEQLAALKNMGFGSGAQLSYLLPILSHIDQIQAKARAIQNTSQGAAGAQIATLAAQEQAAAARFAHAESHLMEALGATVLPKLADWITRLTAVVTEVREWAERHRRLVGVLMETALALAAASAGAATLLLAIGPIFVLAGGILKVAQYAQLLGPAFGALGDMAETARLAVMGLADGTMTFSGIAAEMMATNPVGWILLAAAAVGIAAYEIYEHWAAIKRWGLEALGWVEKFGANFGRMLLVGITGPFGMIAEELYKHWSEIKGAAERIAHGIAGFFVGHSPPPEGPLHQLGHPRLMETLAGALDPGPVLRAARAAAAVTLPVLTMATGAGAANVPAARAGFTPTAPAASAPVVIHYAPTINGVADPAALEAVLRQHARELRELLEEEDAVAARREWGYSV